MGAWEKAPHPMIVKKAPPGRQSVTMVQLLIHYPTLVE